MSQYQYPDHGINDPDIQSLHEQNLPSAEALLAGTLALMTGPTRIACSGTPRRSRFNERRASNPGADCVGRAAGAEFAKAHASLALCAASLRARFSAASPFQATGAEVRIR